MSFSSETISIIQDAAIDYKLNVAGTLAVVSVESAGVAYWTIEGKQVPALRIEGHYFHRLLSKYAPEKLTLAVREGLASPKAGAIKNSNSWAGRYAMFKRMVKIDRNCAIMSCSWGVGQVMGENWQDLGFTSVNHFYKTVMSGLAGQLAAMLKFIIKNGLKDELDALPNMDAARRFAKRYNGSNYAKHGYHTQIVKAYKVFSGTYNSNALEQSHMYEIQKKLKKLGYDVGPLDGLQGERTTSAIQRYQEDHNLAADGLAGPMTIESIDRELSRKSSKVSRDRVIQVGVGTTTIAPTIPKITEAMKEAQDVSSTAKDLLSSFNVSDIAVTIILAGLVGFILYKYVYAVHDDHSNELGA